MFWRFMLLAISLSVLAGCASYDYGYNQDSYQGRVLSVESLEGAKFYSLLFDSTNEFEPSEGERLKALGKPDYIYNESFSVNYLIYQDPPKVIKMEDPTFGNNEYTELDYIPEDFEPYITQCETKVVPRVSISDKIRTVELGMTEADLLELFPEMQLKGQYIDTYKGTPLGDLIGEGEKYHRKNYEMSVPASKPTAYKDEDLHLFVIGDGVLISYRAL